MSQPLMIALQEAGKREGLIPLHIDGDTEAQKSAECLQNHVLTLTLGSSCAQWKMWLLFILNWIWRKKNTQHLGVFRKYFSPWSSGSEAAPPPSLLHFLFHRCPPSTLPHPSIALPSPEGPRPLQGGSRKGRTSFFCGLPLAQNIVPLIKNNILKYLMA